MAADTNKQAPTSATHVHSTRNRDDVLVMHRDEVQRAILAIDVCNELGDLALEPGRVGQRGRCDLDQDDIPNPLRIIMQQLLERTELNR